MDGRFNVRNELCQRYCGDVSVVDVTELQVEFNLKKVQIFTYRNLEALKPSGPSLLCFNPSNKCPLLIS